jgi:DNA primase large subunit
MLKTDAKHLPSSDPDKDHISHYILRLAYCRTEELRRWFLQQECQLFTLRFATSTPEQIDLFMSKANLRYTPIPQSEKDRLAPSLLAVYRSSLYGLAPAKMSVAQKVFQKMDFYKVPFMDVLPLVSKRTVYLEKGFAYVPRTQLATLVQGAFRAKLSKDLAVAYKSANLIQSDERIAPLVRNLGRIAHRMGRAASAVDSESVLSTFTG